MVTRLKMRRIAIYEQQVMFTNIKNNIHSYSKCHSHPFCQSGIWSTDWNALYSLNSASRALDKERLTCHTKYKIHFTKRCSHCWWLVFIWLGHSMSIKVAYTGCIGSNYFFIIFTHHYYILVRLSAGLWLVLISVTCMDK